MKKVATVEVVSPFRKRRFSSTSGHCMMFDRNECKTIPASLLEEAIGIGLVPKEEVDIELGAVPEKLVIPPTNERDAAIKEAIETIMNRNERDDWTGNGKPAPKAVALITGMKADPRVVNRIFQEVKEAAAEAE